MNYYMRETLPLFGMIFSGMFGGLTASSCDNRMMTLKKVYQLNGQGIVIENQFRKYYFLRQTNGAYKLLEDIQREERQRFDSGQLKAKQDLESIAKILEVQK